MEHIIVFNSAEHPQQHIAATSRDPIYQAFSPDWSKG